MAKNREAKLHTQASIFGFIAGILLIVGVMQPWVNGDILGSAPDNTSGIGIAGWGFGHIILLIGLLLITGTWSTPFGIPQKLWAGTLGLSALLIMVAFMVDYTVSDYVTGLESLSPLEKAQALVLNPDLANSLDLDYGVWITVAGGLVGTLGYLRSIASTRSLGLGVPGKLGALHAYSLTGVSIISTVTVFTFPYFFINLGDGPETFHLLDIEIRGSGIIILVLVIKMIVLSYWGSFRKDSVPISMLLTTSVALFLISSPHLFRTLSGAPDQGPLAGNWIITFCSAIMVVITLRALKEKSAA